MIDYIEYNNKLLIFVLGLLGMIWSDISYIIIGEAGGDALPPGFLCCKSPFELAVLKTWRLKNNVSIFKGN